MASTDMCQGQCVDQQDDDAYQRDDGDGDTSERLGKAHQANQPHDRPITSPRTRIRISRLTRVLTILETFTREA